MPKLPLKTLALILILILAAILRIGWPGLTEFKYDESVVMRHAMRLIRLGIPPPILTSSIANLPHPPLMAYLMAIPLLIWRDPAFVVMFWGAMGVAAVGLTCWLGAHYFSPRVGLIAAALFAVAPWAIFYSRKLWPQDIPLITVVMMLGLFALIVERKWWGLIPAVTAAVLLPGLYLGNVVFLAILALAVGLHWRAVWEAFKAASMRDRWLVPLITLLAVVVLVFGMWPWIGALSMGQIHPVGAGTAAGAGSQHSFDPIAQLNQALKIATGWQLHGLAGDKLELYNALLPIPDLSILDQIEMFLSAAGILVIIFKTITAKEPELRRPYSLLLIWMLIPLTIWTLSRLGPQPYRYLGLYPTQFLAIGILIDQLLSYLKEHTTPPALLRVVEVLGAMGLIALIIWQVAEYSALLRLVNTTATNGGHGPAAKLQWDAAREARRLAAPDHLPVVINGTGDTPDVDPEATGFDALLGDLDLRLISGETVTVGTPRGFVHLTTGADGHYAIEVVPPADATGQAVAKLANGIEFIRIEPSGLAAQIKPGKKIGFTAVWRVWGLPPTSDNYSYSVQLFDENWLRYDNINDHFLRTIYWRVGDEIATSGILHIPGDAPTDAGYHLVLTLYTLDDAGNITPVGVVDANFNKIAEFVDVPLQ